MRGGFYIRTPEIRLKQSIAATGRKLSMETRKKISISGKGLKRSKETCRKISISQKNRFFSKETRRKMSISQKKRIFPEDHCRKISVANSGEKNPNWKGGITPLYKQIRMCARNNVWRNAVFSRDSYKCIKCGDKRGGNLNADHIKPFCVIIKEEKIKKLSDINPKSQLWDTDNGRTLCISCHKKTYTWGKDVKSWCRYMN